MSIQSTIEAAAATLPPSLARVAAAIRENPSVVIDMTINELARSATTSVASVVRFCRAIGFSGYAPLRMALATELGKEAAQFSARGAFGSEISDEDTLSEAVSKLASLELLAIEETVARLDFDVLEAAIDAVDRADRILIFGIGASQFVAEDLAHKLLRVAGMPTSPPIRTKRSPRPSCRPPPRSPSGSRMRAPPRRRCASWRRRVPTRGDHRSHVGQGLPLAGAADHALFTRVRESTFRAGAMVSGSRSWRSSTACSSASRSAVSPKPSTRCAGPARPPAPSATELAPASSPRFDTTRPAADRHISVMKRSTYLSTFLNIVAILATPRRREDDDVDV